MQIYIYACENRGRKRRRRVVSERQREVPTYSPLMRRQGETEPVSLIIVQYILKIFYFRKFTKTTFFKHGLKKYV